MFTINNKGIVTDEQGFPANTRELTALQNAVTQSLAVTPFERVAEAKKHCAQHFAGMVDQIDFNKFA